MYWEDSPNGRVFVWDAATGEHRQVYDGELVGGFTLNEDGSLLLFGDHKVMRLDPAAGTAATVATDLAVESGRFNDVMADPEGRVFAGTMGRDGQPVGGLYRVDLDGSITKVVNGTGCANGMGFTNDLKRMYWTDSTAKTIYRFDYDRKTGELSKQTAIFQAENDTPDGMTVDTDGNLWSARWGGYGVFKISPDGEVLDKIELPVEKVSSCIFAGDAMDELWITTAGGSDDADSADGTLYRVKVDAAGRHEFRSRVQF
jgi:D-xylonolactonase